MKLCLAAVCVHVSTAMGADVLVLTSNNDEIDEAVVQTLQAQGHVVTIGPAYFDLDEAYVIGGFEAIYVQPNWNWNIGDMPEGGQEDLLAFLEQGGGIVTCEWLYWKIAIEGRFQLLADVLPATSDGTFDIQEESMLTMVTPDPVMNAGLEESFSFPMDLIEGTETAITAKEGATVFYDSDTSLDGVVGWEALNGRVLSFSYVNGAQPVADASFGTLLANAVTWVAGEGGTACPANCDGNLMLDILDFICYQQLFQSGNEEADINGDGILNILDFVAFQQSFQAGCL